MAESTPIDLSNLFTCLSCSIAFLSAEEQRVHYRSDHHRYNMKRRVAGLPPLSALTFNQKVMDRKAETAIMSSLKGSFCETCRKTYTTENAYRSHINSKKHKEAEIKLMSQPKQPEIVVETEDTNPEDAPTAPSAEEQEVPSHHVEEVDERTIEERIAAARSLILPTNCLFCPITSETLEANLIHMSAAHSFFIPDGEYLVDITGLIAFLGEKIAEHHICIFCNGKGRDFRSLDAVRKHMVDKGHCKIAYDAEVERLEISDFYDFTSSYPEGLAPVKRKKERKEVRTPAIVDEWEDVEDAGSDDGKVDEVIEEVDESTSESDSDSEPTESDEDEVPDNQITYGDSYYELVLPSGARIGHRDMRRYYAQSFRPLPVKNQDPNSGAALVRKLISDKNSALVPTGGGFGAFGHGTDVVKARNRGEAREAGRHVREFRDQNRREQFKTKVGFRHNYQKHFRDPLLQ